MTLFLFLVACAQPTHMQYDFGRAYTTAMTTQTDLARPSVANANYPLTGAEGAGVRQAVEAETKKQQEVAPTLSNKSN